MQKKFFVTGGAGFIGSALVRKLLCDTPHIVLVVDKLTYAGNMDSLDPVAANPRFSFDRADIADASRMRALLRSFQPDVIINLAAESHVDRSIDSPAEFIHTNILGTYVLLEEALGYWRELDRERRLTFRFLHVSTDEVFGSLQATGYFSESSPYHPNSPYSASKAASDHLVRAWHHTFELPTIVTNCSNNYGPYHFPEKLIPLTILNAFQGMPLPVYGTGENVRDWLYVDDHAEALILVANKAPPGTTFTIGARTERSNIDVVRAICRLVDELVPDGTIGRREELIRFVPDRPGHDQRYAIDPTYIEQELGWRPSETFESGLRKTVEWYLRNRLWWERVRSGGYRGERLGLALKLAT